MHYGSDCKYVISCFGLALAGEVEKKHVYEKVVHGVEVIGILQFYQCNVPLSVSLSVIIPSSDVSWRSENLTSDIHSPVPLGMTSFALNL